MLKTPKSKRTFCILWLVMLLNQFVVLFISYRITLHKYGFALNAETFLPLLKDFLPGWFLASLIDLLLLWIALRAYPGSVNIFWHRKDRPHWSLAWSILFGLIVLGKCMFILPNISLENIFYIPSLMLSIYVLGCIRCGVISSNLFSKNNDLSIKSIP